MSYSAVEDVVSRGADLGNPVFQTAARADVPATVMALILSLMIPLENSAFAGPGESPQAPVISKGLWEYQPAGDGDPKAGGYLQCFDERYTPWSTAADSACDGFAKDAWQNAGRSFEKSTVYRWEGEEFIAETTCIGQSSKDAHVLRVSGGWTGDFRNRLLVTAGGGAGFGDRASAISEATALARQRAPAGRWRRVSDCPTAMAPGDCCGLSVAGGEGGDRPCPEGVGRAP